MAWIRSDSSENMVLAVERRLTQLAAKSTPGTVRRDSTQSSPARKVRITADIDNERMELAEERRRLNEAMAAHAAMSYDGKHSDHAGGSGSWSGTRRVHRGSASSGRAGVRSGCTQQERAQPCRRRRLGRRWRRLFCA